MSFITTAIAQTEPVAPAVLEQPSLATQFVPLLLIVLVFYFLIIRPQQKKVKAHQQMVSALRRGDKIVTAGGMLGTVKKVEHDADLAHVDVADGVIVKIRCSTITEVLTRSEPADSANENQEGKKK